MNINKLKFGTILKSEPNKKLFNSPILADTDMMKIKSGGLWASLLEADEGEEPYTEWMNYASANLPSKYFGRTLYEIELESDSNILLFSYDKLIRGELDEFILKHDVLGYVLNLEKILNEYDGILYVLHGFSSLFYDYDDKYQHAALFLKGELDCMVCMHIFKFDKIKNYKIIRGI